MVEVKFESLLWHSFAWGYNHGKPPKLGSVYSDQNTKLVSPIKGQEAKLESDDILADLDAGLLLTLCTN